MELNSIVENLAPYPMEELNRIKRGLIERGQKIYDFGTGDPKIPTWQPIKQALAESIPEISQYPGIRGTQELNRSIRGYLDRRFQLAKDDSSIEVLPTNGSKEAVFHTTICVVGRAGKSTILYPNPGYPVYQSATRFSGGRPMPYTLNEANNHRLEPWTLSKDVQDDLAAVWINYPHNPTGATVDKNYMDQLIQWAEDHNCLILSDECYVDIYDPKAEAPSSFSQYKSKNVVSFMSLSKRSGITGYRSGFLVGESSLVAKLARARANFGVGTATMIQAAATTAWSDDAHVKSRRQIFQDRMTLAVSRLQPLGFIDRGPEATFYLWCPIPKKWARSEVDFSLELAQQGVITSPSSWLSEGIPGYIRFALVPAQEDMNKAFDIIEEFCSKI